jgi:hypothetical protein
MILSIGDKIHVIHRQLFDGDARRHLVGSVEARQASLARVKGCLFAISVRISKQLLGRRTWNRRLAIAFQL